VKIRGGVAAGVEYQLDLPAGVEDFKNKVDVIIVNSGELQESFLDVPSSSPSSSSCPSSNTPAML
jgi:hypothetical protein